jgi:hypothetical protein
VTRLRARRPQFDSRHRHGIFAFTTASKTISRAHPASTQRVKRPEGESEHSPTFSVEVKNSWSCTSTPSFAFMASLPLLLTWQGGRALHLCWGLRIGSNGCQPSDLRVDFGTGPTWRCSWPYLVRNVGRIARIYTVIHWTCLFKINSVPDELTLGTGSDRISSHT